VDLALALGKPDDLAGLIGICDAPGLVGLAKDDDVEVNQIRATGSHRDTLRHSIRVPSGSVRSNCSARPSISQAIGPTGLPYLHGLPGSQTASWWVRGDSSGSSSAGVGAFGVVQAISTRPMTAAPRARRVSLVARVVAGALCS